MKVIDQNLFGTEIVSGVVTRNLDLFPPYGFSISPTNVISSEYVQNCRIAFSKFLNIDETLIFKQKQIHTDNILRIESLNDCKDSDAMITIKRNLCLTISIADCIAILIYDQENQVIAAVHSGWQGTKLNIVGKVIDTLINEYNSNPANLKLYLSPSASIQSYEVGKEFLDFFPNETEFRDGKYYFDNKKRVLNQILEKGCEPKNIIQSELDTISNLDLQSFRRDKDNSGRMSAYIMMK